MNCKNCIHKEVCFVEYFCTSDWQYQKYIGDMCKNWKRKGQTKCSTYPCRSCEHFVQDSELCPHFKCSNFKKEPQKPTVAVINIDGNPTGVFCSGDVNVALLDYEELDCITLEELKDLKSKIDKKGIFGINIIKNKKELNRQIKEYIKELNRLIKDTK